MLQKLKLLVASFSSLIILAAPMALAPAVASAAPPGCEDTSIDNPSCPTGNETDQVNHLIHEIINILTVVVGIASVIMIIVGGFKYVTSGGNQEKVTSAKNTILYALIGLVIVALSQLIAHFVLGKTTEAISGG
jgi:hypothetical protein